MSARVTIVMRTRDRPELLARALDDVLAQTFGDWELVVVNDGGDPAPVDGLLAARSERFAGRAEPMHIPGGSGSMEAAANLGAKHGAGEFVTVHDDDDTWHPDFLAATVAALVAQPEAIAVAVPTEIVYERLRADGTARETGRKRMWMPGGMVSLFDLLLTNRSVPISLLVRRSSYDLVGWYDESLLAVGDWEFNLRLVTAGPVPFLAGEPLAYWHQRPSATGAAANSIFGGSGQHEHFDRVVRERALQSYAASHDLGALLYLTKYIDERLYHYSIAGVVSRFLVRARFRRRRAR